MMIKTVIFDWGDTLMRDYPEQAGPMVTWPHVEAVPGAEEALTALAAAGLRLAVASNAGASDADLMGQALARVGLRRFFAHLWTSKELGASKPAPEFFREAARRAGTVPSQCVMVGNDYAKDIIGAKAAGLHTVWLAAGSDHEMTAAPAADVIINDLRELAAAIRSLPCDGGETPGIC